MDHTSASPPTRHSSRAGVPAACARCYPPAWLGLASCPFPEHDKSVDRLETPFYRFDINILAKYIHQGAGVSRYGITVRPAELLPVSASRSKGETCCIGQPLLRLPLTTYPMMSYEKYLRNCQKGSLLQGGPWDGSSSRTSAVDGAT
jgi:hypothetical protein